MKPYFCLLISFFSFYALRAQSEKGFIVETSLGYKRVHNDPVDAFREFSGTVYGEKINELTSVLTVGKKLKANMYYGLGLLHNANRRELNPDSDIPSWESSAGSGFVTYTSYHHFVSTSNVIGPMVYFQYFTSLTERVFLTLDFNARYDFDRTQTQSTLYNPNPFDNAYEASSEYKTEIKKQYVNIGLFPSLRVSLYKEFGMDLTFGSIQYRAKTFDSMREMDNMTKEFTMGFKPENWMVGFYLKF